MLFPGWIIPESVLWGVKRFLAEKEHHLLLILLESHRSCQPQ